MSHYNPMVELGSPTPQEETKETACSGGVLSFSSSTKGNEEQEDPGAGVEDESVEAALHSLQAKGFDPDLLRQWYISAQSAPVRFNPVAVLANIAANPPDDPNDLAMLAEAIGTQTFTDEQEIER